MNFETVEEFLRKYSIEKPLYDSNGAIHLFKAIVENLQEHFSEIDFEDYSACLDERNEDFLKKLIGEIPKSRKMNLEE